MHVLLLFLISVTAYATSRISNTFPRFQAANFGEMMDGKQLNGSVIKEIEVESESSCRLECVNEERCKSYNFGGKKNKSERWKCQISDSDRFERPARANFIEKKDFSYRGIKVFAMHFKRFWLWSNCFSIYHTDTERISQTTTIRSETEMLTGYFVFRAARRWVVLANRPLTSQSKRAKSTIHLCGIY